MKPRKNNYMFIYSENSNLASQWLEHCKVPQEIVLIAASISVKIFLISSDSASVPLRTISSVCTTFINLRSLYYLY